MYKSQAVAYFCKPCCRICDQDLLGNKRRRDFRLRSLERVRKLWRDGLCLQDEFCAGIFSFDGICRYGGLMAAAPYVRDAELKSPFRNRMCWRSPCSPQVLALPNDAEQSFSWEANQSSAIQEIPPFYGTWRSITAFTNARHLSITWASWIQSIPPHHSFSRSILILSSHLRLGLPSGLLYSVCPTKTVYKPLLYSHTYYMTRPSHSSQFDHPINIGRGVQIIKLIIMQFSPLPLPRPSLRLTYSPQHLVLIHPQPMFLAQYRRPSFTPIQNNRKIFQYRNTDQNNTSN